MKIIKYIFSFFIIGSIMISCSDDDYTTLDDSVTPPTLTADTDFTLKAENADENATSFTWDEAELSVNTPVEYLLEIALGDTDFENPVPLQKSTKTFYDISIGDLNAQALALGIEEEMEGSIDARVVAQIGDGGLNLISETFTFLVTPYSGQIDRTSSWGIVGDAAPNGWDGPDVPFLKTDDDDVFIAYVKLTDGEIKFRENNAWDNDFGGSDNALEAGGDNIPVSAGKYKITIDLNKLTYSIEKFSLGIVGDATPNGWDGPDLELDFDSNSNTFRTVTSLNEGEIKFRLNNEWNEDYGSDEADGILQAGGENIPVEEGTYDIELSLDDLTYSIEPH